MSRVARGGRKIFWRDARDFAPYLRHALFYPVETLFHPATRQRKPDCRLDQYRKHCFRYAPRAALHKDLRAPP